MATKERNKEFRHLINENFYYFYFIRIPIIVDVMGFFGNYATSSKTSA